MGISQILNLRIFLVNRKIKHNPCIIFKSRKSRDGLESKMKLDGFNVEYTISYPYLTLKGLADLLGPNRGYEQILLREQP